MFLGGGMVLDKSVLSSFLCFSEHLLEFVLVWTQSTSSRNARYVILLKQKTMQEWSLISQPDHSVVERIDAH